ncbi:MAG TPA: hypothetical protein VKY74_18710 [Chloroflexia bacterium]|nr:hypothetical protein [Chloroflexia bacterium]
MRLCVLLIEHDASLGERIGHALRSAGFVVMTLTDADEAIDLLCLVAFDLVLADVGTLRYATGRHNALTALLQVLRSAPLLRFTTPATMGPASDGALVLDQLSRDLPHLLDELHALCGSAATRALVV